MEPVEPIFTVDLFPGLAEQLLSLLKSLPPEAWQAPTVCGDWTVQDVAAHLLGGSLGRLAFGRDRTSRSGWAGGPLCYAELLALIDRSNADWTSAARRISPPLLVAFFEITEPQLYEYFKSLPPFGVAGPAVAWAGEAQSQVWFDIAREYTEKWLHQQHIREAVGAPLLNQRQWLYPVLDTFLRALPHAYRALQPQPGTTAWLRITGEAGGDWAVRYEAGGWRLFSGAPAHWDAHAALSDDLAWRLFTRGVTPEAARAGLQIEGDPALGEPVLGMVSIMA